MIPITVLLIVGAIVGWIFKGLASKMEELNAASSAVYGYEPARSTMWFCWIGILVAGGIFPPLWPPLTFLFLNRILQKTSPAITWRMFLLYACLTLCALTIVAVLVGTVAKAITRDNESREFRRRLKERIDHAEIDSL